ncbi:MAG: hypothetical protein WBM69_11600 [Desulfobacterales bacterium]
MFTAKVSGKSKSASLKTAVALLALLFLVIPGSGLLSIDLSQASGDRWHNDRDDDHDNDWKRPRFCSQTAQAAFRACGNEVKDDHWIAVGNCINVSDDEEREDCFNDAKNGEDGYRAAKEECKDQFEARREVCEDLGEDRYDPQVTPADFDDPQPNPYYPLVPGTTWTYVNDEAGETINVEVLSEIKVIEYPADSGQEFNCIVVSDVVTETESGDDIEVTLDWYAQDNAGNVWYFGEIAQNFEDGELVDIEGSWKAGVDGAKPGILMWAYTGFGSEPPQEVYRQEFFLGDAEDIGEFVGWESSITVGGITYSNVLKTKDSTPIEPGVFEFKFYAPGVGLILEEAYEDEVANGETVELFSSSLPLP